MVFPVTSDFLALAPATKHANKHANNKNRCIGDIELCGLCGVVTVAS